jgi:amino-acid N-acetyltransferase
LRTTRKQPKAKVLIRHAGINDVPALAKIINDAAEYGLMLHRSLSDLYENLRDFQVAVDRQTREVVGVCGLKIVWANLAEVYALAVSPQQRGRGIGKQLVLNAIDEAEELGLAKLMTLTYEREFFERCGFTVVDRQNLPLKVWSECARCPKNQACDEIAMIRVLEVEAAPGIQERQEEPPAPAYEVPVPLVIRAAQKQAAS